MRNPRRVDDIEDNSKLRRGVPVAHSIYGVASTINTANYVYFQASGVGAISPSPHLFTVHAPPRPGETALSVLSISVYPNSISGARARTPPVGFVLSRVGGTLRSSRYRGRAMLRHKNRIRSLGFRATLGSGSGSPLFLPDRPSYFALGQMWLMTESLLACSPGTLQRSTSKSDRPTAFCWQNQCRRRWSGRTR